MSPSCKMHERLWIDTGPLISLHRQLPRSGVEPTPIPATAAAQIRGQEEAEPSHRTTGGLWPLMRDMLAVGDTNSAASQKLQSLFLLSASSKISELLAKKGFHWKKKKY